METEPIRSLPPNTRARRIPADGRDGGARRRFEEAWRRQQEPAAGEPQAPAPTELPAPPRLQSDPSPSEETLTAVFTSTSSPDAGRRRSRRQRTGLAMERSDQPRSVIPARAVRREVQPAIVDSGTANDSTMTVVPHVDGDQVAALEVRCSCGNTIVVECDYGEVGT